MAASEESFIRKVIKLQNFPKEGPRSKKLPPNFPKISEHLFLLNFCEQLIVSNRNKHQNNVSIFWQKLPEGKCLDEILLYLKPPPSQHLFVQVQP